MSMSANLLSTSFIFICITSIQSLQPFGNVKVSSIDKEQLQRIVSLAGLVPKLVHNTSFTTYQAPLLDNKKASSQPSITIVNMPYDPVSSLNNSFDSETEEYLVEAYKSYVDELEHDVKRIYLDNDIKKENFQEYLGVQQVINAKWTIALFKYILNAYQQLKNPIQKLLRELKTNTWKRLFNRLQNSPQESFLKNVEKVVDQDIPGLQNLALKVFNNFLEVVEYTKVILPAVSLGGLDLLETENIQSHSPKVVCRQVKNKTIYDLMCLLVKLMNYADQGIKVDEKSHTVSTALFDVNQKDEYDFHVVYLLKTNIEYMNQEKQKFEEAFKLSPFVETLISYRWILDFIFYITSNCKLVSKKITERSENFVKLQELHTKMLLMDHIISEDEKEIIKEMENEKRNKHQGLDKNLLHELDSSKVLELDWFKPQKKAWEEI